MAPPAGGEQPNRKGEKNNGRGAAACDRRGKGIEWTERRCFPSYRQPHSRAESETCEKEHIPTLTYQPRSSLSMYRVQAIGKRRSRGAAAAASTTTTFATAPELE